MALLNTPAKSALAFVAMGFVFFGLVFHALKTGKIHGSGRPVYRDEYPTFYLFGIVFLAGIGGLCFVLAYVVSISTPLPK